MSTVDSHNTVSLQLRLPHPFTPQNCIFCDELSEQIGYGYDSDVNIWDLLIASCCMVAVSHWIRSRHLNKNKLKSFYFLNFWPIQPIHPYIHVLPSMNI